MDPHLRERVQAVADLAGRPGREQAFEAESLALLDELKAAIQQLRELTLAQMTWLRQQAGEQGGRN